VFTVGTTRTIDLVLEAETDAAEPHILPSSNPTSTAMPSSKRRRESIAPKETTAKDITKENNGRKNAGAGRHGVRFM
jgi:hypothetical protein